MLGEFKEELQDKDSLLAKLRQENLELIKDARTVKTYRDELDVLREKVNQSGSRSIFVYEYRPLNF